MAVKEGKADVYETAVDRKKTQKTLVDDLLDEAEEDRA